jgi:hypothetical protein
VFLSGQKFLPLQLKVNHLRQSVDRQHAGLPALLNFVGNETFYESILISLPISGYLVV